MTCSWLIRAINWFTNCSGLILWSHSPHSFRELSCNNWLKLKLFSGDFGEVSLERLLFTVGWLFTDCGLIYIYGMPFQPITHDSAATSLSNLPANIRSWWVKGGNGIEGKKKFLCGTSKDASHLPQQRLSMKFMGTPCIDKYYLQALQLLQLLCFSFAPSFFLEFFVRFGTPPFNCYKKNIVI